MSPGSSLLLHGGEASPRFFEPPPPFNEHEKALANVWGDDEKNGFDVRRAAEAWTKHLVEGTGKNLAEVMIDVESVVARTERVTSPVALICELNNKFRELELI